MTRPHLPIVLVFVALLLTPLEARVWLLPNGKWKAKEGEARLEISQGKFIALYDGDPDDESTPKASYEIEVLASVRSEYHIQILRVVESNMQGPLALRPGEGLWFFYDAPHLDVLFFGTGKAALRSIRFESGQ